MPSKYALNVGLLCLLCMILLITVMRNDIYSNFATISNQFVATRCEDNPNLISIDLDSIMRGPVHLQQDDPKLIQRIRRSYLYHPDLNVPYNLSKSIEDPSMGQSEKIKELLSNKNNGFFIECGALDGETRSNTLFFEKHLGWKGIIIEGDPSNFKLLLSKRRKAIAVAACLSTLPYPKTVMFQQHFNLGKISQLEVGSLRHGFTEVQCLPLYSILLAVGNTNVDYFSLDVEGNELEVLKTIPWDQLEIKTLSVEFIHDKEGKEAIREYMKEQGYEVYAEVIHAGHLANDFIFFNPKYL